MHDLLGVDLSAADNLTRSLVQSHSRHNSQGKGATLDGSDFVQLAEYLLDSKSGTKHRVATGSTSPLPHISNTLKAATTTSLDV